MSSRRIQISVFLALCAMALSVVFAEQVDLVDSDGNFVAYIDTDRDSSIFLWSGEPVAYLYPSGANILVYSFAGQHLGWYESGILRDLDGDAVGSRSGVLNTPTRVKPVKGIQRILPFKGVRQVARVRPVFSNYYSNQPLDRFLSGTPTTASPRASTSSPSGGAYAATGVKWWVSRVESGGSIVTLSDGSRWEIYSIDRIHTMLWLPVDDVTVSLARSPIGSYRYTLRHERSGREVLGEYLGR